MKKILAICILCFSLLLISQTSLAQHRGIGVGGMLNSPTGISLKGWVNQDLALDGAISFNIARGASSLYLHSDVLYHGYSLNEDVNISEGDLRVYYGGGFRFLWFDNQNDATIGLRAPVGLNYQIEDFSSETFFELVPTVDLNPIFRFGFAGAIGFRYYLN